MLLYVCSVLQVKKIEVKTLDASLEKVVGGEVCVNHDV